MHSIYYLSTNSFHSHLPFHLAFASNQIIDQHYWEQMKLEEEKKKQIIAQGQPAAQQQVYLA